VRLPLLAPVLVRWPTKAHAESGNRLGLCAGRPRDPWAARRDQGGHRGLRLAAMLWLYGRGMAPADGGLDRLGRARPSRTRCRAPSRSRAASPPRRRHDRRISLPACRRSACRASRCRCAGFGAAAGRTHRCGSRRAVRRAQGAVAALKSEGPRLLRTATIGARRSYAGHGPNSSSPARTLAVPRRGVAGTGLHQDGSTPSARRSQFDPADRSSTLRSTAPAGHRRRFPERTGADGRVRAVPGPGSPRAGVRSRVSRDEREP